MGWTYTYRPKGVTTADWFEREFGMKFKATATKAGVFYAVIELDAEKEARLVPDANGKVRVALVLLTKWAKGDYNFGWKDMDEFMGPVESTAPAAVLDFLSPIADDAKGDGAKYARDWRARCRANIDRRKAAPKLRAGMVVKLPAPMEFRNGAKIDTFTVVKRGRKVLFRNDYVLYRLTARARENLLVVTG
jgi:hypothetical protein